MRNILAFSAAILLAACGGNGYKQPHIAAAPTLASAEWEVGPILDGETKSINVPSRPIDTPEGKVVRFPFPTVDAGHVHYVTTNLGKLTGKSSMTLDYRIDMGEGVELRAAKPMDGIARPAMLTLYFQRCGDDWLATADGYSGRQGTEDYRWYATFATVTPVLAGDGSITVSLADLRWSATQTSTATSNPTGFAEAIADTCRVGFVLGGGDGYGHGVYATGPASILIKDFRID